MKLIPYEKIKLQTNFEKSEAIKSLAAVTQKRKVVVFGFGKNQPNKDKLFDGTMTNDSFAIQRIISYRNSFLPQIKGTFAENKLGTEIEIIFKLHPFVMVFMIIWLGILTALLVGLIFVGTEEELFPLLIAAGMLIFGLSMVVFAFNYELKKAKKALEDVWKVKLVKK